VAIHFADVIQAERGAVVAEGSGGEGGVGSGARGNDLRGIFGGGGRGMGGRGIFGGGICGGVRGNGRVIVREVEIELIVVRV